MSARADLATIIGEQFEHQTGPDCNICADVNRAAAAVEVMGYRKLRTVTTRNEVLALHEGAVLLDSAGDVAQLRGGLWCGYETSPMSPTQQAKYIPATVLHEGEDRS